MLTIVSLASCGVQQRPHRICCPLELIIVWYVVCWTTYLAHLAHHAHDSTSCQTAPGCKPRGVGRRSLVSMLSRILQPGQIAHRGELCDTQAERARQSPPGCRQWTTRTSRMLYTWQEKGVKRVSTWSKAVRMAMLKEGAEFQRQKVLNRAAGNWNKEFLRTTDKGVARMQQIACTGVKCEFMNSIRWEWECMLQLQETEDRKTPAATTWAAEFLLRVGESKSS
jgi:hypothetical protein